MREGPVSRHGSEWSVNSAKKTGADRSVATSRVAHPVSMSVFASTSPETLQSARSTMQASKQEVAELETKYAKKIDEDAKILVLRSIMPEAQFGEAGVLRGK